MKLEYGARLPRCKTVYMHSSSLESVNKFIAEYSSASPLELVTREYIGERHNGWH